MRKITLLIILLSLFLIVHNADASVYLVDTGYPSIPNNYVAIWNGQWEANEFTVSSIPYYITDIQGYFCTRSPDASVTVEITQDGGEFPSNTVIYSNSFNIPGVSSNNWYGISGISGFKLMPGTYWIVFKSFSDPFRAAMTYTAQYPLGNGATSWEHGASWASWVGNDTLDLSIRIAGNPIPEPATLSLLGLGLLGLAFKKKKLS